MDLNKHARLWDVYTVYGIAKQRHAKKALFLIGHKLWDKNLHHNIFKAKNNMVMTQI